MVREAGIEPTTFGFGGLLQPYDMPPKSTKVHYSL